MEPAEAETWVLLPGSPFEWADPRLGRSSARSAPCPTQILSALNPDEREAVLQVASGTLEEQIFICSAGRFRFVHRRGDEGYGYDVYVDASAPPEVAEKAPPERARSNHESSPPCSELFREVGDETSRTGKRANTQKPIGERVRELLESGEDGTREPAREVEKATTRNSEQLPAHVATLIDRQDSIKSDLGEATSAIARLERQIAELRAIGTPTPCINQVNYANTFRIWIALIALTVFLVMVAVHSTLQQRELSRSLMDLRKSVEENAKTSEAMGEKLHDALLLVESARQPQPEEGLIKQIPETNLPKTTGQASVPVVAPTPAAPAELPRPDTVGSESTAKEPGLPQPKLR